MSRFYLTTAIDFVNSRPHLGTAYEKITADVIARYKRLCGMDTLFVMGNDEHSQNVFRKAADEGLDALAYCDQMEDVFRATWRSLDISFDDFIRTTQPRHHAGVTEIVRRLHQTGDIYAGVYEGWYCVGCEAFKQEKDLVDGRCPLHPVNTLDWIKEQNSFFRLSKYRRPLLEHIQAHPEFIQPDVRRNEILRLLEAGLEDISVSRAGQAWGIPLPFDPRSVVYVWFDALINYVSAVGFGTNQALFDRWWPADLHIIGKDITRFHTVIWPAMLMAADVPLPVHVFAHGFMTVNGLRMSKSLGTVIDPLEAVGRFGADPLRLYLTKEIAFGGDGDFSWDRYNERYNVDLANNLGNLVSRVSTMVARYRNGRVAPAAQGNDKLARLGEATGERYRQSMDRLLIHEGAAAAFDLVDATNEYIAETAPWTLAKNPADADRLSQVLFDAAEAIRLAAVLLTPFMPSSSAEILRRVGTDDVSLLLERDGRWRGDGERVLAPDGPLWPRAERVPALSTDVPGSPHAATGGKETLVTDTPTPHEPPSPSAAPSPAAANHAAAPAGVDRISIEDFMKVELRVAKVLAAEHVPKSSRLLKLTVDVGSERRTIVAGIAEAYEPEALIGRTVVIVFNLKLAKLMGVESNGMVLAASSEDGKPVLVSFEQPPPPGSRVR